MSRIFLHISPLRSPASNGQSIVHQFFHGRLLLLIAILQEINQVLSMIPGSFLGRAGRCCWFHLGLRETMVLFDLFFTIKYCGVL